MTRSVIVPILLVAAVVATYCQTATFELLDFDDAEYVSKNNAVLGGLTVEGIQWAFTSDYLMNWHPVTWISLMMDAYITRAIGWRPTNPTIYHVTNVAFHAANVCLLFHVLLSLTGAFWRSAAVAAIFALHPIHVESVAWVSERKDVLSALFLLLTIRFYVRYVRDDDWTSYAWMCICFALGLMSKAMLVTLPFALLLLDFWPLGRMQLPWMPRSDAMAKRLLPSAKISRLILEKLPLLGLATVSSITTYLVQVGGKTLEDGMWMPMGPRIENAVVSYVRYIQKLIRPVDLAALYPNPSMIGQPFWEPWQMIGAAAALVLVTALAILLSRRQPYFVVGWLWFVGTMIPVIGIVQIGRHAMADRYAYVPFIGLYIAIVWGIADLTKGWKSRSVPLAAASALILCVLAWLTFIQSRHWRDSVALFEHAIAVTDDNWLMHHNLAVLRARGGNRSAALDELNKALTIFPQCSWMLKYKGELLAQSNQLYDAQVAFEEAIRHRPEYPDALSKLGIIFVQRQQLDAAKEKFEQALSIQPDFFDARKGLAVVLEAQGDLPTARQVVEEGMKLDPARETEYREILATLNRSGD